MITTKKIEQIKHYDLVIPNTVINSQLFNHIRYDRNT